MIRIILLFALVATLSLTLQAQPTLDNSYFPAVGDTLRTAIDNSPEGIDLLGNGGPRAWDFTNLQADVKREQIIEVPSVMAPFPNADQVIPFLNTAFGYYNVSADRYELVGYEGFDPLGQGLEVTTPFNPPYVERWAPLALFDVRTNSSALTYTIASSELPPAILDLLPIAPDSVRLRVQIDRTDVVDGWGTAAVFAGTYDVLRERRTEQRNVRLDVKVSFLPWTDVTDLVSGGFPIQGLGRDTTVDYRFWSDGIKEPIAIITTDADGVSLRSAVFKDNGVVADVTDFAVPGLQVRAYPNPGNGSFTLDLAGFAPGDYPVVVYNALGQLRYQSRWSLPGGTIQQPIDLTALPTGLYYLQLLDANGRILATQRIQVTK